MKRSFLTALAIFWTGIVVINAAIWAVVIVAWLFGRIDDHFGSTGSFVYVLVVLFLCVWAIVYFVQDYLASRVKDRDGP